MQSDYKEIYKMTAKRTGKDEFLYKDIGNFVFAELYSMFRKPKWLIIKLKGIGFWFLRRKRLYGVINMYPPNFEKTEEDFTSQYSFLKNENKKAIYTLFQERLKEYEEYVKDKKFIRTERNKTQVLLKPKSEDNES